MAGELSREFPVGGTAGEGGRVSHNALEFTMKVEEANLSNQQRFGNSPTRRCCSVEYIGAMVMATYNTSSESLYDVD